MSTRHCTRTEERFHDLIRPPIPPDDVAVHATPTGTVKTEDYEKVEFLFADPSPNPWEAARASR